MASKLLYLGVCFVTIALDPRIIGGFGLGNEDAGLWFTKQPPRQVIAQKSLPFSLDCSAEGGPSKGNVTITWIKDGAAVVSDDRRYQLRNNGSLFFKRVIHRKEKSRTDEGTYYCAAHNQLGTILSNPSQLSVAGLKQFVESGEPQDVTVREGESARLKCMAEGKPPPTISWEKDRRPLPRHNRYTVLPSGVLQIINVVQSDGGEYRCTASNIMRARHSSHASLSVITEGPSGPAHILARPHDLTRSVGETAILECLASGSPLPQIVWTRQDGSPVIEDGERVTILGQGNLQISNLTKTDQGQYVCQLQDDSEVHELATLSVVEPPVLTMSPVNIVVDFPQDCKLECNYEHFDTITWMFNGQKLQETWGNITIEDGGRKLRIRWCLPRHTGLYQCMAENTAGYLSHTINFTADLLDIPKVPNIQGEAQSATTILLSWDEPTIEVFGHDIKIIAYSVHYRPKDGAEKQKVVVSQTFTVVDGLEPYTEYNLQVWAYTNKMYAPPSDSIVVHTLESVPLRAPVAEAIAEGPTSILVQWKPLSVKEARGIVTSYKLFWRKAGDGTHTEVPLGADTLEYLIEGLVPDEEYEVRVLAATQVGSPILYVWPWVSALTGIGPNTGVPLEPYLVLKQIAPDQLRASWMMPPNGPRPYGFELTYWEQNQEKPRVSASLMADDSTFRITQIKADTVYKVEVIAFNGVGKGPPAIQQAHLEAETTADVGEDLLPIPQNVRVSPVNSTAVRISWDLPPPNIHFSHCMVRYSIVPRSGTSSHAQNDTSVPLISTNNSLLITDLKPFTRYSFRVRYHKKKTHGSVGELNLHGSFSEPAICRTFEGLPSAPQNASLKLLGDRAIQVCWQPPTEQRGTIVFYLVQFRMHAQVQGEEAIWDEKRENAGSSQCTVVEELQADTMYSFRIRAATEAGEGTSTAELLEKTPRTIVRGNERELGIIIGVAVGGTCIILCALILFIRSRYCVEHHHASRGPALYANGNGHIPNGHVPVCPAGDYPDDSEAREPMMTQIPHDKHLDTKGSSRPNGTVHHPPPGSNGVQVSLNSNGKVSTFLSPDHPAVKVLQVRSQAPQYGGTTPQEPLCYPVEDTSPETQQSSTDQTHCSLEDIDYSEHSDDEAETSFGREADTAKCLHCGHHLPQHSAMPCGGRQRQQRVCPECRHPVPTSPPGPRVQDSETDRPMSGSLQNGHVVRGEEERAPRQGRGNSNGNAGYGGPWQERTSRSTQPQNLSPASTPAAAAAATVTQPSNLQSHGSYVTSAL